MCGVVAFCVMACVMLVMGLVNLVVILILLAIVRRGDEGVAYEGGVVHVFTTGVCGVWILGL